MDTVAYKTVGGLSIQADVYPVISARPAPVLVLIHGGALIMGNRRGIRPVLRDMCARAGIAQLSIDYRLAPETKLPEIVADIEDAFAWARGEGAARFNLDPGRVGALGWSAGGYLALMSGFRVDPPPRVVVSFYGYGDIAGPWYSEPDPFYCRQPAVSRETAMASVGARAITEPPPGDNRFQFYLYCRQQGLWPREVSGFDPHVNPNAFDPFCPIRHVTPAYPPTLLFHGTADTDVPCQQSVDMAAALERMGVEHQLVNVQDGWHGFDGGVRLEDLENMPLSAGAAAFVRTLGFVRRHLAG